MDLTNFWIAMNSIFGGIFGGFIGFTLAKIMLTKEEK